MVDWKKLGEISKRNKGIPITAGQMNELSTPNGNVRVFAAGQTIADIKEDDLPTNCAYKKPSIIVKSRGYIDFEFYEKPFTHKNEMWSYSFNDRQNGKFIFYFLTTKTEFFRKKAKANSVKLPQLCVADTDNYLIPIPSLSEQQRIVGILDTFASSIENLKEQIAKRRKQYEYYRDQLLDLEGKEGVEMKHISDVAKSFTGLTYKPENVSEEGTLVLRSSNIDEDVLAFDDNVFVQMVIPDRAIVKENDILICVRNGSKRLVGKAAIITKKAEGMAFGAFMTILRSFAINSKFLFYVWQSEKVRRQYKGDEAMPIAQITAKDFQRIVIPVPPLSEQQRIVSILDTFEASIQNLEAQLKEREKQYEYYRNKLLTFE
jgi:type I restriction enzyme S subunit